MIFTHTELAGAFIIDVEPIEDDRGFFARCWCRKEFEDHGLNPHLAQCNISYNQHRGTLRGMHFQNAPHEETKVVRCINGAIFDVIVDLRQESRTFRQWYGSELNADNRRAMYVPEGFAHGFITLQDDSEVLYQMSEYYMAANSTGIRWNDPVFAIKWPVEVVSVSERDSGFTLW